MYGSTATNSATERESAHAAAPAIDLRSDTVTKPTAEMRAAMAAAEVGDDVYAEDPTVNRLQETAAKIFGREAAIFVPSGSMGNLIAIKVWTHHGSEVICEQRGHINQMEMASMCAIAGCLPRTVPSPTGILTWQMIEPLIRAKTYYYSQTAMVSLENTHNMAGGTVYPTDVAYDICKKAHEAGLRVHLDGARVFNAAVALKKSVADITKHFDSIMFCLSKGLGAPVGSMLVGSKEFIERARVYRKMLGGGMRQAGVLAAAGLIAIEKSPARLHEDHANARFLAEGLSRIPGIKLDLATVQTNIVSFDVSATKKTAADLTAELGKRGVLCGPTDKYSIRMVTHYDVDRAAIERALEIVGGLGHA
jgi:threonine aldolase